MQESGTIRLFKRGPTAEFRLFVFVLLALSLLVVDSRWKVLDPARQAISVVIYPFQRLILAPRNALEHIDNWADAAALARSEKEALPPPRTHSAQITQQSPHLAAEKQHSPPM